MHTLPRFESFVLDAAYRTDAGIVDEDVQAAKFFPGGFDRSLPATLTAYVLLECDCFVEILRVNFLCGLPGAVHIYIGQNNACAFGDKKSRRFSAQTLCSSGNQSNFILDPTHAI